MLKGTEKIWDSSIANMGILFVNLYFRDRVPAYLEAIYPPFWRRELDIEDIDVVKRCLEASDVESAGFDDFVNGEGRQMHDHILAHRFDAGMYGVPTYVMEEDVFFGREHLPIFAGYSPANEARHLIFVMRWFHDYRLHRL